MSAADLMDFSPEVAEARSAKKPIVALESTIITHGMPYPRNVETARCRRGRRARDGGRSGDDRGRRRALESRPRGAGDRAARPAQRRRGEGFAARSGAGCRPQGLGGHDGRRDDVHRRARGHRNLRHWRHRRRAPRRRGDIRHLRRSGRAVAHPRRGRVRRRRSRSSISGRRSNSSKPRGSRSSATAPTSSQPSSLARPGSSSSTAATGCAISPA